MKNPNCSTYAQGTRQRGASWRRSLEKIITHRDLKTRLYVIRAFLESIDDDFIGSCKSHAQSLVGEKETPALRRILFDRYGGIRSSQHSKFETRARTNSSSTEDIRRYTSQPVEALTASSVEIPLKKKRLLEISQVKNSRHYLIRNQMVSMKKVQSVVTKVSVSETLCNCKCAR